MKLEIELDNRAYASPLNNPISTSETSGGKENKEGFPAFTFYYDEPRQFPEEGTMVIKYCLLRSDSDNRRPEDSKYSCTIAVEELVSAEGEKDMSPSKRDTSASDALDKLAQEKADEQNGGSDY